MYRTIYPFHCRSCGKQDIDGPLPEVISVCWPCYHIALRELGRDAIYVEKLGHWADRRGTTWYRVMDDVLCAVDTGKAKTTAALTKLQKALRK